MIETTQGWRRRNVKPKDDGLVLCVDESLSGSLRYTLGYYYDNCWWDSDNQFMSRIKYWTPLPDIEKTFSGKK